MKKTSLLILLLGSIVFSPLSAYAAYPVFDATNNVLATLQKAMDSAYQSLQKANVATLIKQAKEDYAEQVKIYEECVKQYEECVKIYKQAMKMYDWIDTNVGNARNLKTFLSCGFSDVRNLQQMTLLLNTTLSQTATSTNRDYNSTLLQRADRIINNDVMQNSAKQGIEMQNYAQASSKSADKSDSIAQTMLTKLRTKDQVLEARVSAGTADLMQLAHANEQATIFIAEKLARVNSNVSAVNRTVSKQLEIEGRREMDKVQEAAAYGIMENEAVTRGSNYTKQRDTRNRINDIFSNCRAF